MIELGIAIASVMAGVHFLGEELEEYISGYREQIVSFGSGVSISYVFMRLLPEFSRFASDSSVFFFPLAGFSVLHLVEKYLAVSDLPADTVRRDYAEIHSGFLFVYHGAIGYLAASLVSESAVSGLLFFLPVVFHVGVSSFSISELHEQMSSNIAVKLAVSAAPVAGALLHKSGTVSQSLFEPLFGVVVGMFFYIVVRDSIPEGSDGKPAEFLAGAVLYLAVILLAGI